MRARERMSRWGRVACGLAILGWAIGVGAADVAPVETRAEELFAVLRGAPDSAAETALIEGFHRPLLSLGPIGLHRQQLAMMRSAAGAFTVQEIRLADPHRGDFILQNEDGKTFQLHLETEPIPPFAIAGIGFDAYDPTLEMPEFTSLDQADTALAQLAARGEFAGVVLVAREGQPDWGHAYGQADRSRKVDNTLDTRFDIGSITKMFTGLAVIQLSEAGKVELEAPIGRYLTGFPKAIADKVRVIDLLRMESGYGDYFGGEFEKRRPQLERVADYLEWFKSFELEFEPGTQQRYSNVGFVLLGGIIESVSEMPYHDYVARHIFAPAKMASSGFRDLTQRQPGTAVGYTNRSGSDERYGDDNRSLMEPFGTPAGGSVSTAGDLLRFNRALRADQLASPKGTTFVLNRYRPSDRRPSRIGIAGGAPGVSAVDIEDIEAGVTVIVLCNLDEPIAETVGERLLAMATRETAVAGGR